MIGGVKVFFITLLSVWKTKNCLNCSKNWKNWSRIRNLVRIFVKELVLMGSRGFGVFLSSYAFSEYFDNDFLSWSFKTIEIFVRRTKGNMSEKTAKKQKLFNFLIWERYVSFHKLQYTLHLILEGFSKIISTCVRIDPWRWPYKRHNISLWNIKFSSME